MQAFWTRWSVAVRWPYDNRDYNIIITQGGRTMNILMILQSCHYLASRQLVQIFNTSAGLVNFTPKQYFLWLIRFQTYQKFRYTRLPQLFLAYRAIHILMTTNPINTFKFVSLYPQYIKRSSPYLVWKNI